MTRGIPKPKVLKLGTVQIAHEAWKNLESVVDVIDCKSPNREAFLWDLDTKYKDAGIVAIARTYYSIDQTGKFDAELISHLPESLRSISTKGTGYDQLDPYALGQRGIQLSNVPFFVSVPTAETTIFLILQALRNYHQGHELLLKGEWKRLKGAAAAGSGLGKTPQGKVLGIIGMGTIGREVRDRAKPFGFSKILYHNRTRLPPELENGAVYVTYDELLKLSDVISINIPLSKKTWHLVNQESISEMKDGVIIVNTSRGAIIDEKALLKGLKTGKIGAAGLDVFEKEPDICQELVGLPNVYGIPHMGGHTIETQKAMEEFVVENVRNMLYKGKVISLVSEQKEFEFDICPVINDDNQP